MSHTMKTSATKTLMTRWARSASALALSAAMAVAASAAGAATVTFTATNLTDTTVGEDLRQYDYTVSGAMQSFESINVLFDQTQFSQLTWLSLSTSDLDLAPLVQPDLVLGAAGIATLTAQTDLLASFSRTVSLTFVWTGAGDPGKQPLEFIDANGNLFATPSTVPNTPAIPEPSTVALTLGGLGLLAWRRRSAARPA